MLIKGQVVTIEGDNLCGTITNKGLLETKHNHDVKELYNCVVVVRRRTHNWATFCLTQKESYKLLKSF